MNDFRGQDESSRDSGGIHGHGGSLSGSQPCDTFNHGPESGYSQSDGAGTHIDQLSIKGLIFGETHTQMNSYPIFFFFSKKKGKQIIGDIFSNIE